MFNKYPSYQWFKRIKNASIEIKCYQSGDEWTWNVYAHIFEKHPLFNNIKKAINLPFHGGCNYSYIKTLTPARGGEEEKILVLGCDYGYLADDYYQSCDPSEGIPPTILKDAEELMKALDRENDI